MTNLESAPARQLQAKKPTLPAKKPRAKTPINKSEFIRQHPDMKAGPMCELAASLGFKITPNFVYTIRAQANTKNRKPSRITVLPPGRPVTLITRRTGLRLKLTPEEVPTLKLAIQHGTAYVRTLMDDIESYLMAMATGPEAPSIQK